MTTVTYNLTRVCLPICLLGYLELVFLIARARYRSANREAQRFKEAQARGAFQDMNNPENKRKYRWRSILGLVGLLGLCGSMGLPAINLYFEYRFASMWVFYLLFGISGILLLVVGLWMRREIDRRL